MSGCATRTKHAETEMIQIASYRESDKATAGVSFRILHEHGIWPGGIGGGGWIEVCVYPSQAEEARKILRNTLSRMSPDQRKHAFQVFD